MELYNSATTARERSNEILELLYQYDTFMDSISTIVDMGCGTGEDIRWWATLMNRDDPPEPHDYACFAVDKNIGKLDTDIAALPNITSIAGNFEERLIPRKVDFIWSMDSFQYALNPLGTLKVWNDTMNVNGMLAITVPQHQSYAFNRLVTRGVNGCYYPYNACNLMYMLAVNGFDCKDSFFLKEINSPWLTALVYKSDVLPMDPATTSWFDLVDKGLVNESVAQSLDNYGEVRQEELVFSWLDKDFKLIRD